MLREFVLQPNEEKRIQFEGKYLIVTQATGPVELNIGGTTPITVDEKDRVYLNDNSPNDRAIRIKNISGGINKLEIHTSDLLVDKRTGVDVKNAIQIADDQRIGIDPTANIVQAVIQNAVRIDAAQNTITIAKGQCVGIDPDKNTVKAFISNPVAIDPKHNRVTVTRRKKAFLALPAVVFTAPEPTTEDNDDDTESDDSDTVTDSIITHNVAANTHREQLLLSADPNNTDVIWIGDAENTGTPIFAGDRLFIEGSNALTLVAKAGQRAYLSEVTSK